MSTAQLARIPFNGGTLAAAEVNGIPHVSVRHVCDALGIDTRSQLRKLNSRSWAVVVKMTMTAADGKDYVTSLVDRRTLTMWLATITTNAVAEDAREMLDAYQTEAADALDAYFNRGGVAVRPGADVSSIDMLRGMLDQLEANQKAAAEAKQIATTTAARLDAIEGRHDWFSALGWARANRIRDTSTGAMRRLGVRAAKATRDAGYEPHKVQHAIYGWVNQYPAWALEAAAEESTVL